jgi:hypothetical protein
MSNRRPSSKVVARGADGVSSLDSAQVASFASRSGPGGDQPGHEQIVMVFSCGDWKPGHHLGIKIPRIGLAPAGPVSPDERRRAARGLPRWVAAASAGPPTLFDHPRGGYPRPEDSS